MRKAKDTIISDRVLKPAQQLIHDQVDFSLAPKQWKEFCDSLDAPPKAIPALRRLLTEVNDEEIKEVMKRAMVANE